MITTPIQQGRYRVTCELNLPALEHRHLLGYPQLPGVCHCLLLLLLLLLPYGLVLKGRLSRQPVRT